LKPPPRHWRNHFAGLRVLGGDNAGERRADDGVVELLLPGGDLSLGDDDI